MDADAKMCLARDSVWRLLRVMLLQASDQVITSSSLLLSSLELGDTTIYEP